MKLKRWMAVAAVTGLVVGVGGSAAAQDEPHVAIGALASVGVLNDAVDEGAVGVALGEVDVPAQQISINSDVVEGAGEAVSEGTVVFEDSLRDTDGVVQELPDGVRMLSIAKGPAAPTSIDYEFSGAVLTLAESGDGSVVVSVGDVPTAIIEPAWAIDARGREVPTRFEIEGDTLTQITEHHGYTYPVVSDPKSVGVCVLSYLPAVCIKYTRAETVQMYNRLAAGAAAGTVAIAGCDYLKRYGSPAVALCRALVAARLVDFTTSVQTAYAKGSGWCLDVRMWWPILQGQNLDFRAVKC